MTTPGKSTVELPADDVRELLEAALTWRAQGSLSRWTTLPSKKLARLVSRLADEHSVALAEVVERARHNVITDVVRAAERLKTPAGRARELTEIHADMSACMARLSAVADATLEDDEPAPPTPPLPRTRELLRRFAAQWSASESVNLELLREVLDAFEAEDLAD